MHIVYFLYFNFTSQKISHFGEHGYLVLRPPERGEFAAVAATGGGVNLSEVAVVVAYWL